MHKGSDVVGVIGEQRYVEKEYCRVGVVANVCVESVFKGTRGL